MVHGGSPQPAGDEQPDAIRHPQNAREENELAFGRQGRCRTGFPRRERPDILRELALEERDAIRTFDVHDSALPHAVSKS